MDKLSQLPMKDSTLQQAVIAQNSFISARDARSLVTNVCQFLSLTLQPKEILFCSVIDELSCFSRQKKGQALSYYDISRSQFSSDLSENELWRLAQKKTNFLGIYSH